MKVLEFQKAATQCYRLSLHDGGFFCGNDHYFMLEHLVTTAAPKRLNAALCIDLCISI